MKYLTFPFLLLLLPLIGFGCSSEEKEADSLILSSDSEIFFEQGIDFAATSGTQNLSFSSGRPWRISLTTDTIHAERQTGVRCLHLREQRAMLL